MASRSASHKAPLTRVQSKRRARVQRRLALIPLMLLFAARALRGVDGRPAASGAQQACGNQ